MCLYLHVRAGCRAAPGDRWRSVCQYLSVMYLYLCVCIYTYGLDAEQRRVAGGDVARLAGSARHQAHLLAGGRGRARRRHGRRHRTRRARAQRHTAGRPRRRRCRPLHLPTARQHCTSCSTSGQRPAHTDTRTHSTYTQPRAEQARGHGHTRINGTQRGENGEGSVKYILG